MLKKPTYKELEIEIRTLSEKLSSNETILRELQQVSKTGYWEWNIKQETLAWSDEIYHLFDMHPDKFKPSVEALEAMIHPDDLDDYLTKRKAGFKETKKNCMDYRIVLADDSIRYVRERSQLIVDNQNEIAQVFGTAQNITSQKKTERFLQEKEFYLSQAQVIAQLGYWRLNPETEEIIGSDELFKIFNLSKAQGALDPFMKVVHPEDRDRALYLLKRGLKDGLPWDVKYRLLLQDGTEKTVHAIGAVIKDKHGKAIELMGAVQDITIQAMAEKVLRESESKFKSLAANTPNIVFTIDRYGNILYMNHAPEGIDINQIIGSSMYVHMVPDNQDRVKRMVDFVFTEGESGQYECRGMVTNGKSTDYLSNIGPVFDDSGKVTAAIISTQDITERKYAEALLLENENKYRLLAENASDVVFRTKISDGSYEYISPSAHAMFGYQPDCFYENSQILSELLPEEWTTYFADKRKELLNGQRPPSYEFPIIHKRTNEIRWMQQRNDWIFEENDVLIALQGRVSDITERKRVEDALKKSHETLEERVKERTSNLEDLNAALTVLLKKRDEDKKEIEEKIFTNYKLLILPFIKKLKNSLTTKDQQNLMEIVEYSLGESLQPFSQKLSDPLVNLTPTEIQIAGMVKQGLSNKEIAQALNNSIRTITNHRQHIRLKLGLKNKKINLRSYLSTL